MKVSELDKEIFTPVVSGWKMYGEILRRLRIWSDVTQEKFASISGWSQQHQNKLENTHVTIISNDKRDEIIETFRRIGKQTSNTAADKLVTLCSFCFEINYRYRVDGHKAYRKVIDYGLTLGLFEVYTGWTARYMRYLMVATENKESRTIAQRTAFRLQRAFNEAEKKVIR